MLLVPERRRSRRLPTRDPRGASIERAEQSKSETIQTIARHAGPRGEVVLRRRLGEGPSTEELIINGVFAMDSSETSTERLLGELAVPSGRAERVLVGGLGLGYTVAEISAKDVGVIDVMEIEQCLIDWAHQGITATLAAAGSDSRIRFHAADVRLAFQGSYDGLAGQWDAIVLDVDNGPDFLIHGENRALYTEAGLRAAYAQLAPGGTLAIWCQRPAPPLLAVLARVAASHASTSSRSLVESAASGTRSIHCRGRRTFRVTLSKDVPMTQPTDVGEYRIEHDTMGEVRVPAAALWKAQTQRAIENFPISGIPINSELIAALGLIKEAAAETNAALGVLSQEYADAIAKAASEVAANQHDAEFPLDVFQTGSGTSSNMNANEVIASLATAELGQTVHPNDHVNASQSSNDVFPSAIHIAATQCLVHTLLPALRHLAETLEPQGRRIRRGSQGRSHALDGRHSGYPRPRIWRLRRTDSLRHGAGECSPSASG